MNTAVELMRDAAEPNGRDRFSCSLRQWRFLVELGVTFGWAPLGTTYELPRGSKLAQPALRDYEPGESADVKRVSTEDAASWARALQLACESPHLAGVIAAQFPPTDENTAAELTRVTNMVREFTVYAFGGAFAFTLQRASHSVRG